MVRPQELVESLLFVLQNTGEFPEKTNFVGYEPDIASESIKLPLVQVSLGTMLEVDTTNSEFVGYREDADGNIIGRIYESLYEQDIQISVWTAHGSKYSPRDLSNIVRDTLYPYTSYGPDDTLPHPELDGLDEVWFVEVTEGDHTDDLGTSPSLRRWQQIVEINASERYITNADEPPIDEIENTINDDQTFTVTSTGGSLDVQ